MPEDAVVLVLTNVPERHLAEQLANTLVESRLAACVNVLSPVTSVYRWDGKVAREAETPLLIKTSSARYAALELAIRERHPDELPEIIALPVQGGLTAYLNWVLAETQVEAK